MIRPITLGGVVLDEELEEVEHVEIGFVADRHEFREARRRSGAGAARGC